MGTYEFPGYYQIQQGNRFMTIGSEGLQLRGSEDSDEIVSEGPEGLPADGWDTVAVFEENTGGGCIVTFYQFQNGHYASITEDCAVLWPASFATRDDFLDAFYGGEGEGFDESIATMWWDQVEEGLSPDVRYSKNYDFYIRADWANVTSQIMWSDHYDMREDIWHSTPWQVADVNGDHELAAEWVYNS